MAQTQISERRLQPATIALALAALIAVGVLAYTIGFRRGESGTAPETNASASAAATNATAAADPDQQAAIAAAQSRIETLQEALRRDPDNHQAWFELGQLYRDFERFADAAGAFRRASELQPNNSSYQNYLGEMLVFTATRARQPLTEAERYFRRALELEPGNAMSRFYLATIKNDHGDHRGAVDDLLALLRDPPRGEPLPPEVRRSVIALARENHIDISGRLPPEAPAGRGRGQHGLRRRPGDRGHPRPDAGPAARRRRDDAVAAERHGPLHGRPARRPAASESARRPRLDHADALAHGAQRAAARRRSPADRAGHLPE